MSRELISKKDLLDLTGISYGQLYRWKRKKLIPEEWFIKKSSFTGQETFFPKEKILDRIDKIKNMKDDLSLDQIANMFAPKLADVFLNKHELKEKGILSDITLNIYSSINGEEEAFSFEKILFLYTVELFIKSGEASIEEGKNILLTLEGNYRKFKSKGCEVILVRKFGVAICILISPQSEIFIEDSAKFIKKINMAKCIEELKIKIFGKSTINNIK
ncbi:hypothetical protein CLTEP_08760 [Clostridium tepidiprofundi DSM 19306]|uniref:DUF4004 family protein n=1 Tax=Clostridium tepidiprofundi DSM 19306 TaxID=1121338 RepID=A0A151B5P7_9CLOT|nr:YhbD family protein [Clostridium tepidiprofundi]KYH35251.1 hypothetical protein CLTEP_08760 [Clostridium tepidiprofundi DSM 19306]